MPATTSSVVPMQKARAAGRRVGEGAAEYPADGQGDVDPALLPPAGAVGQTVAAGLRDRCDTAQRRGRWA